MKISSIDVVGKTIDKVAECVKQTYGAKGRLAVINDEFSRPLLTDDGVTVARQFMHLDDPFEKMVALSMCEAATNTERYAFDGTTLTILMIQELYRYGQRLIKKRKIDPQLVAHHIEMQMNLIRKSLQKQTIKLDKDKAEQLATVTTKMPIIGKLVRQAYIKAGDSMNIIIEHDRKRETDSHKVDFIDGMVVDHGFFSNEMQQLCNDETHTKTVFKNAHLVLLSEGMMSQRDINNFFRSIPSDEIASPYVFFITKAFNPESLKILLDQLVTNKLTFQFVFVNETNPEEFFIDLAARTNGQIQSAAQGTSEYKFEHTGFASEITIEQEKTTIISEPDAVRVEQRIAAYKKELADNKYVNSTTRMDTINRRLSNLQGGVVKIRLACQTSTEYMTIRLKLDDAIGAVRCAAKEGLLPGGGTAMFHESCALGQYREFKGLSAILRAPLLAICKNAGYKVTRKTLKYLKENKSFCVNVNTMGYASVESAGLYDSFSSIDRAIANATSIACSYLKAYVLIHPTAV